MKHHNDHNETNKPISLGSSRQSWPCFLCPGLLSASAARPFCTKTLHSSSKVKLTSWNNHGISWIIMGWNQPRSLYRTSFHLEGQLCPKMHQHASDRASKLWRGMSNVGNACCRICRCLMLSPLSSYLTHAGRMMPDASSRAVWNVWRLQPASVQMQRLFLCIAQH